MRPLKFSFLILISSFLWGEDASFKADQAIFSSRGKETVLSLKGNAFVESTDYTIRAGELLMEGESQDKLEGSEGISLTNRKETLAIKGDSFSLDRTRDILIVRGKVELADSERKLTLSGLEVQIWGEGKRVLGLGAVRFTKEGIYGEAETLRFDEESNTLDLIGQARLERKDERLEARRIWVNLNNDQIISEDQVTGRVKVKDDETQKESP